MGQYLYQINTTDGVYIGKLVSTNFLADHLMRGSTALPWIETNGYSWENKWKQDIAKNGFKNQTFVQEGYCWDASEVINKLKRYFDKVDRFTDAQGKNISFWQALKEVWYKSTGDDYAIAEALCILLAAKTNTLLNTQVDFLSRPANQVLDETYARQLISTEEMEARQLRALKSEPQFYITITSNNGLLEELSDILDKTIFNKISGGKSQTIRLNDNKALARALTHALTKKAQKHLIQRLTEYKKSISGPGSKTAKQNLQDAIDLIKQDSFTTAGETYDYIFNAITNGKKELLKKSSNTWMKRKQNYVASVLLDWYNNCTITDFLTPHSPITAEEGAGKKYKEEFCKWLMGLVRSRHLDILHRFSSAFSYQEFKKDFAINGEPLTVPYHQIFNSVSEVNFPFVIENWHDIYYEQFGIWVKEYDVWENKDYTLENTDIQNITVY